MPTQNTPDTADVKKSMRTGSDVYSGSPTAGQRPDSIRDALRMLDDAISRDGSNLQEMVGNEFSNLRDAIAQMKPKVADTFRQYSTQAYDKAQGYLSDGLERSQKVARQVDASVRENPWPTIAGAMVGGLTLGLILGRSRNSSMH